MANVLIILGLLFGVPALARFLTGSDRPMHFAGLAAVFGFTGVGHFILTGELVEMLPAWLPARSQAVLASGVFELGLSVALLTRRTRRQAAGIGMLFLVAVLPVNVWAAVNHVGPGGHGWGPIYLLVRVPLQVVLIHACRSVRLAVCSSSSSTTRNRSLKSIA